jgi:hypothetical protein
MGRLTKREKREWKDWKGEKGIGRLEEKKGMRRLTEREDNGKIGTERRE